MDLLKARKEVFDLDGIEVFAAGYDEAGTALFSDKEQAAVVKRILEPGEYSRSSPHSTGVSGEQTSGYLWPLSTAEALYLPSKTFRSASALWWLRSPGGQVFGAAGVKSAGTVSTVGGYDVGRDNGVRPAFYLNLNSVLFTSAAAGGKASGSVGPGALKEVGMNAGNEWKLTLKDDGTITGLDGHKGFSAAFDSVSGYVATVKIDSAKKGAGEWISAIVRAASGDIRYYGRVALCSDDVPTSVSIDLEGKFVSGDALLVFNEQYNGDKKTDYASELKKIDIPSYTVSFDVQGRGTAPAVQTAAIWGGYRVMEPSAPSAPGWTFGGWYKEAACTNEWDFTTDTVTGNMTLYAGWTANVTPLPTPDPTPTPTPDPDPQPDPTGDPGATLKAVGVPTTGGMAEVRLSGTATFELGTWFGEDRKPATPTSLTVYVDGKARGEVSVTNGRFVLPAIDDDEYELQVEATLPDGSTLKSDKLYVVAGRGTLTAPDLKASPTSAREGDRVTFDLGEWINKREVVVPEGVRWILNGVDVTDLVTGGKLTVEAIDGGDGTMTLIVTATLPNGLTGTATVRVTVTPAPDEGDEEETPGTSGGGGCDAGLGVLALLALAATRRRR